MQVVVMRIRLGCWRGACGVEGCVVWATRLPRRGSEVAGWNPGIGDRMKKQ